MSATEQAGEQLCITAQEVADLLRISPRRLERRATWTPKFPAPICRRPLVWRRADILKWIDDAAYAAKRAA